MNKKFTFMVAALLAAGGFSANAVIETTQVQKVEKIDASKSYYIVYDGDADAGASENSTYNKTESEYFLGIENDETEGKVKVASVAATTADIKSKAILWKVEEKTQANGDVYYSFYNEATGAYLTMAMDNTTQSGSSATAPAFYTTKVDKVEAYGETSSYFTFGDDAEKYVGASKLVIVGATANEKENLNGQTLVGVADGDAKNFYVMEAAPQPVTDASALNATMGGDGFSLAPSDDDVEVAKENNIFSKAVKAIYVNTEFTANEKTIPVGMYFATDCPAEVAEGLAANDVLNGGSSDETKVAALALFEQCTFIAVSPDQTYGTSSLSNSGLKLIEVNGADLVKTAQVTGDQTTGSKVWVHNAAFKVTEIDPIHNPERYTLEVPKLRYQSKADGTHAVTTASTKIGVTSINSVNYVTTTLTEVTVFKPVNSTIKSGLELVADSKTPSIFNIQFVSGEGVDSENGKYLGVGVQSSTLGLVAQGEALVDLESAQYRFVISEVTEDNVVTFTNLETGTTLSASLYELEDGSYRISTANTMDIAKSGEVSAEKYATSKSIDNMEIKLIPVEANVEGGFLVKEVNNNEPFKFAFALKENSKIKYYLSESETEDATELSDEEADALQFVFEPVEDGIGEIKQNFIYTEDGKRRVANATMAQYQKYILRVVEADDTRYAKVDGSSNEIKLDGTSQNATKFIAKVNYDGSVSLIQADATVTFNANLVEFSVNDATTPTAANLTSGTASKVYFVPNSSNATTAISSYGMFLVSEELGISLEAESKHVSLESENGGFIKVAENGDGIVDNLATATTEDLTFWLDTTNSKSVLPAFYISKAGKFLFNANDSIAAWEKEHETGVNPYKVGDRAKAIFKAATLVDSETLKTTVENKEVSVAAEADQNKGIVGGIGNFQFNIVKANDSEDNYILRSVEGAKYVTSNNNVLVLTGDKDAAMRVIVSAAQAPTSNESVSASEVKVIANNGSVVVKNAAGKNVVVSTILGQVVANEVLTSDNATINVPAGIVVVAVEGESFKVNVK